MVRIVGDTEVGVVTIEVGVVQTEVGEVTEGEMVPGDMAVVMLREVNVTKPPQTIFTVIGHSLTLNLVKTSKRVKVVPVVLRRDPQLAIVKPAL